MLHPEDLVVLYRLALLQSDPRSVEGDSAESDARDWTYASLAAELAMSVANVHGAVRRAQQSGLVSAMPDDRPHAVRPSGRPRARIDLNRAGLLELTLHGVRWVYPAERGPITRGVPTSHSASPLREQLAGADEAPLVWPDREGTVRGESITPLAKTVPAAARRNAPLYELLTLVDAIRIGRARERKLATDLLRARLS